MKKKKGKMHNKALRNMGVLYKIVFRRQKTLDMGECSVENNYIM